MGQKKGICFVRRIRRRLRFRHLIQSIRSALSRARGFDLRLALTAWALSVLFLASGATSRAEVTQLASVSAGQPTAGLSPASVEAILDKLPLSFEANKGQFDERVKFLARTHGRNLFVTGEGMVMVFATGDRANPVRTVVKLEFEGAAQDTGFAGLDRLAAITNYFDERHITNVPNFARVRQLDVYPGIDVIYYGNHDRLEHDFMVFPGADARSIRLRLSGHDAARVSEAGDLLIETKAGQLQLHKPLAYQERDGARTEVAARYAVIGSELRFEVGDYDRSSPLVIDPILSYSTLLGGNNTDVAYGIAIDANGNTYVAGATFSTNFPLAGAFQTTLVGSPDVFVTKLNANGTGLIYSTYIGGKKGGSTARGIAVDSGGNAYIAGNTTSSAYPVTSAAYLTTSSGDSGFVTKLGPQGNALVYSTFAGSPKNAIAIDEGGNAYVTGIFASVLKLNASGTAAVYVWNFQGNPTCNGIAVDTAGNAYVTGVVTSTNFPVVNALQSTLNGTEDAFIAKINPAGTGLVYSTYLGGSLRDRGNAIAVDTLGNVYVVGTTYSADFPVSNAFQPFKAYTGEAQEYVNQAFITKFNASGNAIVYSSYLGGKGCLGPGGGSCLVSSQTDDDGATAVAVDAAGNAYLAGYATSILFPQAEEMQSLLQWDYGGSLPFAAMVRSNGALVYSVALGTKPYGGGKATGIAVDANGNVYAAGYMDDPFNMPDPFPTTPGAFQTVNDGKDAVIFKLSLGRYTTTLSAPSQATSADILTLTADVLSAVPDGTVTFRNSGTPIGSAPVSGGVATLQTTLPAGVHELTAVYSGDNKVSRPVFLPVKQALICN